MGIGVDFEASSTGLAADPTFPKVVVDVPDSGQPNVAGHVGARVCSDDLGGSGHGPKPERHSASRALALARGWAHLVCHAHPAWVDQVDVD